MALTGSTIASTYLKLLRINTDTMGADATASYIQDSADTDSALSISTTRVGIGTAAPLSTMDISASATSPTVQIGVYSTTDGHTPIFRLQKSGSATIGTMAATADGEALGRIDFNGVDTSSATKIAAMITGYQDGSPDSDSVLGRLQFHTSDADDAGSPTERMRIDSSGNVGIGGAPDSNWDTTDRPVLEIGRNASISSTRGAGDNHAWFASNLYHDGLEWKHISVDANDKGSIIELTDGKVKFWNANVKRAAGSTASEVLNMTIDATGAITAPLQPAFLARGTGDQSNFAIDTAVTVVFGTEVFDQGGDFASNTFTAPVSGRYLLSFNLRLQAIDSAASSYEAKIITSNRYYAAFVFDPDFGQDNAYYDLGGTVLADMDASDTAYITIRQGGGTQQTDLGGGDTQSYFSGYLAC